MDVHAKAMLGIFFSWFVCMIGLLWSAAQTDDRRHDANAVRREAIMLGYASGTPPEYADFEWVRK